MFSDSVPQLCGFYCSWQPFQQQMPYTYDILGKRLVNIRISLPRALSHTEDRHIKTFWSKTNCWVWWCWCLEATLTAVTQCEALRVLDQHVLSCFIVHGPTFYLYIYLGCHNQVFCAPYPSLRILSNCRCRVSILVFGSHFKYNKSNEYRDVQRVYIKS